MERFTTLLNQDELTPEQIAQLAQQWLAAMREFAHSKLVQFERIRVHFDIETDVLLNDTFMDMLKNWPNPSKNTKAFYAYSRTAMRNTCIDYARRLDAAKRKPLANKVGLEGDVSDEKSEGNDEQQIERLDFVMEKLGELIDSDEAMGIVAHQMFILRSSLREIQEATGIKKDKVSSLAGKAIKWITLQAEIHGLL